MVDYNEYCIIPIRPQHVNDEVHGYGLIRPGGNGVRYQEPELGEVWGFYFLAHIAGTAVFYYVSFHSFPVKLLT